MCASATTYDSYSRQLRRDDTIYLPVFQQRSTQGKSPSILKTLVLFMVKMARMSPQASNNASKLQKFGCQVTPEGEDHLRQYSPMLFLCSRPWCQQFLVTWRDTVHQFSLIGDIFGSFSSRILDTSHISHIPRHFQSTAVSTDRIYRLC